jgi:hypothetical protein
MGTGASPVSAEPYTVLCARCWYPWHENDDRVRYIPVADGHYDWFCADETECDNNMRYLDLRAGGHSDGV